MSSTQPTTSTSSVLNVPPTTEVTNNSPAASLGKDSFLKLLVTQMQDQDPTSPTDSSAFMSQLAQFSSLEQMTNMSDTMTSLANTSAVTQGVDLIGRNINYTRADGSTGSGIADSVSISSNGAVIGVGTDKVDPSEITSVGLASTATTTPSSSTQSTPTS